MTAYTELQPEEMAQWLEESLTWRELRKLAKRNGIKQYSYHTKKRLAILLAYQSFNRLARK